ncbi:hypothetical protein, partial [Gloeomargarita lithophora]|uniref:hypothetical protein n=1 Tax=Gloeomargarita lithophora TaxID=1188228 RepID=UPI001C12BC5E
FFLRLHDICLPPVFYSPGSKQVGIYCRLMGDQIAPAIYPIPYQSFAKTVFPNTGHLAVVDTFDELTP